jgi:hypothetical protein
MLKVPLTSYRLKAVLGELPVVMDSLSELKVVHDFDNPYMSGRWALRRGIQLITYALSRKISFLKRYCREVYAENEANSYTLYALDRLLGIRGIFGINDVVEKEFSGLRKRLGELGAPTVRHWHVSKDEVHWEPELGIPRTQWWFDQEYSCGIRSPKPDEWLVFHCDYPHLLPAYIQCLYELRFGRKLS